MSRYLSAKTTKNLKNYQHKFYGSVLCISLYLITAFVQVASAIWLLWELIVALQ